MLVLTSHLGVRHWRQGAVDAGGGGGHRQQGGDGQRHPGRGRLVVQPEGHPGDADRHEGGDVDGEDVVRQLVEGRCLMLDNPSKTDLSFEHHVYREATVDPCRGLYVALEIFSKLREPSEQTHTIDSQISSQRFRLFERRKKCPII